MTRDDTLQRLIDLGRDVFDEDDFTFDPSTRFEDVKEWDSMNHMRMVVAMERAFGIRFSIGDLQRAMGISSA